MVPDQNLSKHSPFSVGCMGSGTFHLLLHLPDVCFFPLIVCADVIDNWVDTSVSSTACLHSAALHLLSLLVRQEVPQKPFFNSLLIYSMLFKSRLVSQPLHFLCCSLSIYLLSVKDGSRLQWFTPSAALRTVPEGRSHNLLWKGRG